MSGIALLLPLGIACLSSLATTQCNSPTLRFIGKDRADLSYSGHSILSFQASGLGRRDLSEVAVLTENESPVEPMFLGYPHGPKTADWTPKGRTRRSWTLELRDPAVTISGTVSRKGDRRPYSTIPNVPLASTFGKVVPSFANSIYDRDADWLLEFDHKLTSDVAAFGFKGASFTLKADYYRDHLGYFLWDRARRLWPKPVAGWCSWAAYGQDVTEGDVAKAAEFFGHNLKDYGYDVIQIDDGYQRVLQLTDNHQPITEPFANYWTKPNERFPHGMTAMAKTIASYGLTPGIWIGLYLPIGLQHAADYVTDADGKPHQGPWVGYAMDGLKPDAVKEAYTDTLITFREQGWKYFKIDTLRHVLYDSYRQVPAYWTARGTESSYAYRKLFEQVRAAVGPSNYLLACWGALPELAGLPDGCRIGEDVGPSFASMRKSAKYIAQFHHANNVIWRNDPDYMCFRVPLAQCQTWATLTSLTGEHVMVSDPVSTYDPEKLDVLRRVGPPVVAHPAVASPLAPDPEWATFSAEAGGQSWTVAARMAWTTLPAKQQDSAELGLDSAQQYLAFDFWKSKFLGVVKGAADFDALAPGECQVVSFRLVTGAPQMLGDDRHISQGAHELRKIKWDGSSLSGEYQIEPGKAWSLYLYVPDGWTPASQAGLVMVEPHAWKLTFAEGQGWKPWSVRFTTGP